MLWGEKGEKNEEVRGSQKGGLEKKAKGIEATSIEHPEAP